MSKPELRKKYIQSRAALAPNELAEKNKLIFLNVSQLGPWLSAVHIFLSSEDHHEISTFPIIQELWKNKVTTVVPRLVEGTREMDAVVFNNQSRLNINKFGIREPIGGIAYEGSYSAIFIPLLAFDKSGNRLGYGKGYYDFFLSTVGANTVKIGLSHFPPMDNLDEVEDHDVPLDLCVTPEEIFKFNR